MLELVAGHGLFDLEVTASGDLQTGGHHTVEDVGICLGIALAEAVGDKSGINRYGSMLAAHGRIAGAGGARPERAALLRLRRWTGRRGSIAGFDADLVAEFFRAVVNNARMTLHVRVLAGGDPHHTIEAVLQGLRQALWIRRCRIDPGAARRPFDQGVLWPRSSVALHRRLRLGQPALGPEGVRACGRATRWWGPIPGACATAPGPGAARRGRLRRGHGSSWRHGVWSEPMRERIEAGVPFLGVCLGLQLLFERERGGPGGAGARDRCRGDVRACRRRLKVPHIGWNQVELVHGLRSASTGSPTARPSTSCTATRWCRARPGDVLTMTDYDGVTFVSGVEVDNVAAVQFHPEKSSTLGLRFYRNFARRASGPSGPAQEDAMRLFPAIDIQGGRCVRLRRGDFADETVFGDDPVAMAEHWVGEGARFLHVVDLDGAREGEPRNFASGARPSPRRCRCPWRPAAASAPRRRSSGRPKPRWPRLVLGTSAVEDEAFLSRALALLGADRLVVAVDAEDGFVKTQGWQSAERHDRVLDLVAQPGGRWACARSSTPTSAATA